MTTDINESRLMRLLQPLRRPLFLLTLLLAGVPGCYRVAPATGGAPAVGRELVLELSDRGAVELAPQLGVQLRSVRGRVADFSNNTYQVSVTETTDRSRVTTLWRGEPATIPADYVVSVAERQLDKGRSWAAAGITVAAVALAGKAFGVDFGLGHVFGTRGGGTRQ